MFCLKVLTKKKNKVFMGGFLEIKERVGWIVKQEKHAEDKKEKKEKVILLAVRQNRCAILAKDTKKALKEFLGKRETKHNEAFKF
jgi:hypothetical protein